MEYNSNYADMIGSLWFYSKHKETNFDAANIANTNAFKSSSIRLNYQEIQLQMEIIQF